MQNNTRIKIELNIFMSDEDKPAQELEIVRDFRPVKVPESPKDDYQEARRNVYEMMTRNADALEQLIQVAAQAPHPRVFEVVGQLVSHGLEASQSLMDIKKKNEEFPQQDDNPQVLNQTLIVTSAELLERLKNKPSE